MQAVAASPDPGAGSVQAFEIILTAVSPPGLDDIRITDNLFPVGRNEPAFLPLPAALVADLSRRHARIFYEFGAAYLADLGSKNGTTINGVALRQKPRRLAEGDEICFARALCFRVRLKPTVASVPALRLVGMCLKPANDELGLLPVRIDRFPFLISKNDEIFARHREKHPHQVNYISRRHAHIFLKNGLPCVEDLGSTNGTWVDGRRLDEHAVALADGTLLAFGGHGMAYRVSLQLEAVAEPTATQISEAAAEAASNDADKTTFLAAPDSFLDIFCIDAAPAVDDEINREIEAPPDTPANVSESPRPKSWMLTQALWQALTGDDERPRKRRWPWLAALAASVAALSILLLFSGGPEEAVHELLAEGRAAEAAALARQSIASQPDNLRLRALGTQAVLKADVPRWLVQLRQHDFAGAATTLAAAKESAAGNAEAQPLLAELHWLAALEQFVASRKGSDAPIRLFADEERIAAFLQYWNDDAAGHQRAYTAIAAHVPAFGEWYPEPLSHLRKLQSDDAVYLAAIERLKTTIALELERNRPDALAAVFDDYAEKYPRIQGIDVLRQALQQYVTITDEAAAAWAEGDTRQSLARLEQIQGGPWGDAARAEADRQQRIAAAFAELDKARGTPAYDKRLQAFSSLLEAGRDDFYLHAIGSQEARHHDAAPLPAPSPAAQR